MKLAHWAIAGVLSLGAAQAYDGQVSVNDHAGRIGTGGGGPFEVAVVGSPAGPLGQVKAAAGGGTFLSFCVELNEHLQLGGAFDANVAQVAVNGGVGGPHPDPVSLTTAYLYSQFRAGNIATTAQSQDDLQNAIWWLEEEIGNGNLSSNAKALINSAIGATGLNLGAGYGFTDSTTEAALRGLNANGAYGVRILNLYNGPGADNHLNQDLLAIVPEPSTYAFAALLGLPVLLQLRRRFRS